MENGLRRRGRGDLTSTVTATLSEEMETNSVTHSESKTSSDYSCTDCTACVTPPSTSSTAQNCKSKNKKGNYCIAVHLGAGKHSMKRKCQDQYNSLCRQACMKALAILKTGGSADDAVIVATKVLEDSGLVNAGKGSELNSKGKVECDAAYMSGSGYFGGVGAIPGCPNPTLVARKIAQLNLTRENLIPGAVPPIVLTGIGAKEWAASQGITVCDDNDLISSRALRSHEKVLSQMKDQEKNPKRKRSSDSDESDDSDLDNEPHVISDTVGAVAVDCNGHVASTVSTGGNQLKFPGRIGHVPLFGCGCWACDMTDGPDGTSLPAITVSTTGVGEMLSKINWASECASCLQSENHDTPVEAMHYAIQKKFLESPLLRFHTEPKLIGALALLWNGRHGELVYGFHAPTFIFAYAGSKYPVPEVKMLTTTSSSPTEVQIGGLDF